MALRWQVRWNTKGKYKHAYLKHQRHGDHNTSYFQLRIGCNKNDKTRVYDDTYGTGEHTYLQALLALTKTNKGW